MELPEMTNLAWTCVAQASVDARLRGDLLVFLLRGLFALGKGRFRSCFITWIQALLFSSL